MVAAVAGVQHTWVPSIVSVKVLLLPAAFVTAMPTGCVPATVAFGGGAVNDAAIVAGCTVIRREGGLGSLAPELSVTSSETSYTPGVENTTAPGVAEALEAGVPPGKVHA